MVINFFGKRGTGKTTAIRGLIKYCRSPVVIIDVLGNFNEPGFKEVETIPDAISALQEYCEKKTPKIISLKTQDPTLAAEYMSASLWQIYGGTLVLDEIDSIDLSDGDCFDQLIRYGRNHNVDLITGCRRPAELSRNITAAANKFYCFQTHEWRDIEYFQNALFGERAELLMTLPEYHGLFLDYDKKSWGEFRIDILGNLYHLSEQSLNQTIKEPEK